HNAWPGGGAPFRTKPLGDAAPLPPSIGYQSRFFWIPPYAGSNLAVQAPRGIHGGRNGAVTAGILWDTRDDEQNAHQGFLLQLAGRKAAQATASLYDYGGVTFGLRVFFSLWTPPPVLALHGLAGYLLGGVPLLELKHIGGLPPPHGLRGLGSPPAPPP